MTTVRLAAAAVVFGLAMSPVCAQQAFRMTDLDLRDPHLVGNFPIFGCTDFTDSTPFGFSFNQQLATEISTDSDADGFLDLSILAEFLPLDASQPTNLVAIGEARCTSPAATTTCTRPASSNLSGDAAIQTTGICLAPYANTLHDPYTPEVTSTDASCFRSVQGDITFDVGGIALTLQDAELAAKFSGNPTDALVNGLVRGFLSEADADATTIPPSYPVVGGQPLSSILPGGTGNCASHDARDTIDGTPGGTRGWWFYFNFAAGTAVIDDPFGDGFRDSFEDLVP